METDATNGAGAAKPTVRVPKTVQDIKTDNDLKVFLAVNYKQQIKNFFGDEEAALRFLSNVMADVQKRPEILKCEQASVINSYITMAQLGLMPSGVSGEAYVIPYKNGDRMIAQFQLGYQGLITLFYRAGGTSIRTEIVRENDQFSYENGLVSHKVDIKKSRVARGKAVAAYAIATVNGNEMCSVMNGEDILAHGGKFSKSFGSKYTPWNEENDPELWMWKKTVLKQLGKLLPKNETIYKAIAEDNEDSVISDRKKMEALVDESRLTMGSFASLPAKSDDGEGANTSNQEKGNAS